MLGLEARASRAKRSRPLSRPLPSQSTALAGTGTPNRARAPWPAGGCRAHPRARESQRPPEGDWRVWGYVAGRGAGKTRAGACWVQHRQAGVMKLGCLIAPTSADIRDVMVEGPSGLLAVAPPWCRPQFEPSKRRVSWPNGARAVCLSGEEPERARGFNVDTLWADKLACWQRVESERPEERTRRKGHASQREPLPGGRMM